MAQSKSKRKTKNQPLTWTEFEELSRTDAQLADPADAVPKAAAIKAQITELNQLSVARGKALFRRIQSQSEVFTEADREELMKLAGNAVNGGIILAALQEGGRLAIARHTMGKPGREAYTAKVQAWRDKAEELAAGVLIESPSVRGNATEIMRRIYDELKASCPEVGERETVAKYLAKSEVSARIEKKLADKKDSCA